MFERFTDRARKVMALSNQEAHRLGHAYIGTEHLLLGLVLEGSGMEANVIKSFDVELHKVRMEVEKIIESRTDGLEGKPPQTPRAKKVIEYALLEARDFKHKHVGTEHILLGLLREGQGVAYTVLTALGIAYDPARNRVIELLAES